MGQSEHTGYDRSMQTSHGTCAHVLPRLVDAASNAATLLDHSIGGSSPACGARASVGGSASWVFNHKARTPLRHYHTTKPPYYKITSIKIIIIIF
jgi:hypothetical protein